MLEFVNRREIDDKKWDDVVAHSPSETLYPYSWYLDAAAENWSALIMDDYRFIMPLVWKRKYGISFLYQPFYTQQLGVFSQEFVDPATISAMLSHLPKKFISGNINFNSGNLVSEQGSFHVGDKKNYRLLLRHSYDQLRHSYSNNTRRNINRTMALNDKILKNVTTDELIRLKKDYDVIKRSGQSYRWMQELLETILNRGSGVIYGSVDGNQLEAAAFFGFSRKRAIYLVAVSSERGKQNRSMFKVVDAFIREHAGSDLILDFEGSNIPSVARFFEGFGADPEIYQNIRFNRLPVPLKRWQVHV